MHCFDCAEQNVDRPAVGTCMDCGAGVCAEHARPERRPVTCRVVGLTVVDHPARVAARILRCSACGQVRTTIAACETQGGRDC
ncbi:DUF2180 family protein [Sciscionella marina]|uniref:DUF2180 family protein n=1 Tax=Sciscionella marina TaxID=508770 RepID=UPI0003762833|nr:DUF2180 family protein [Sciscionella marina]